MGMSVTGLKGVLLLASMEARTLVNGSLGSAHRDTVANRTSGFTENQVSRRMHSEVTIMIPVKSFILVPCKRARNNRLGEPRSSLSN